MHLAAPEPHSLALACGLSSLFIGLVMASIRNPWVEARGALLFAGAALATTLSFMMVALAQRVDDSVLVTLRGANTVLIFGLLVAGIARFVGRSAPWLPLALSMVAMALLIQFYPESRSDVSPRVLGFSLLVVGWSLTGVWILLRHPITGLPPLGPAFTVGGLVALASIAATRALVLLRDGAVSGELAFHDPLNGWLLLAGFAALLCTLTGMALMLNGRMVLELQRLASHDPLTGAFNRKGFNTAWPTWLQTHGPGRVVLMDLETDTGETPDEEALMLLVNRLRELMPPHALLGRQSGGGFLVALPQAVLESEVQACCERLQVDVHQSLALLGAGRESPPTLSIGHAPVRQDLAEACRRANLAMDDGRRRRRPRAAS